MNMDNIDKIDLINKRIEFLTGVVESEKNDLNNLNIDDHLEKIIDTNNLIEKRNKQIKALQEEKTLLTELV